MRARRSYLLTLLLMLVNLAMFGQGQPRRNAPQTSNTLQIRITAENDRALSDERLRVQLLNAGGVPLTETFSSPEGYAEFGEVGPGNYQVHVTGNSIEPTTSEMFTIQSGGSVPTIYIQAKLKSSAGESAAPPRVGAIISMSDLNAPPKARAELDKGNEAFAKDDLKTASERFQKAIALYPQYARAYNNLGVVEMRQGEKDQAKANFEKSVSLDERFVPGYINLARQALSNDNAADATAQLKKALAVDPNHAEALALMARALYISKNYDEALTVAQRVHTLPHDHYSEVHLIAGNVLMAEGQPKEAAVEFTIYLKENPDSPRATAVRQMLAKLQAQAQ